MSTGPVTWERLFETIANNAALLTEAAAVAHERSMRMLRTQYGKLVPWSEAPILGGLVGLFGALLFVAALPRQ